ncbi:SLOG family protein [Nocardia sp. NPDC050435]|uniref:SLOG family protein n=1 Tax=Nocardia sp. NPDC050435 TaxID=3155040 RepID=UPI0033C33723
MTERLLFTGPRAWTKYLTLQMNLTMVWKQLGRPESLELVHGDARGADRMAATIWRRLGLPVRAMPADWATHGKAAGVLRNQGMVDLGGYVHAVAAWIPGSRGTADCMARIRRAQIPLTVITTTE